MAAEIPGDYLRQRGLTLLALKLRFLDQLWRRLRIAGNQGRIVLDLNVRYHVEIRKYLLSNFAKYRRRHVATVVSAERLVNNDYDHHRGIVDRREADERTNIFCW